MALLKMLPVLKITKKLKSATLIESLVASVIIITIFSIASLTLNNVFRSHIKANKSNVENRMNELSYLLCHNKLKFPYAEEFEGYTIKILKQETGTLPAYIIEGTNKEKNQLITRVIKYDNPK